MNKAILTLFLVISSIYIATSQTSFLRKVVERNRLLIEDISIFIQGQNSGIKLEKVQEYGYTEIKG